MKKLIFIPLMFVVIRAQAQSIFKVKDSIFSIATEQINSSRGSRTVTYSDFVDSTTVVDMYFGLLDSKFKALVSHSYESEFTNLDSTFFKFCGFTFIDYSKHKIRQALQGSFYVLSDDKTFKDSIEVKETLVYKNSAIAGSVDISNYDRFTVNGIIKDPLTFIISDNKKGAIATFKGKKYYLQTIPNKIGIKG